MHNDESVFKKAQNAALVSRAFLDLQHVNS